jgi:hypothetical protein
MQTQAFQDPFRHWHIEGAISQDQALASWQAVPPPEWPGWEAHYDNDLEHGKQAARFLERGPLADLLYQLTQRCWVRDLAVLADVPDLEYDEDFHGAGLHAMQPRGWLQVHGDYERHPRHLALERRLSLVLFLNPTWREEWGGALLLTDPKGNTSRRYYPRAGAAVVFENGNTAFHGVEEIAPDAPPRVTLACYYLAPARRQAHRLRAMFLPNRQAPQAPAEVRLGSQ